MYRYESIPAPSRQVWVESSVTIDEVSLDPNIPYLALTNPTETRFSLGPSRVIPSHLVRFSHIQGNRASVDDLLLIYAL